VNRRELLDNLKNEDPDVVVDLLDISTEELLAKFPTKLARYIAQETDNEVEEDE
jgi:hypothetical protein